MYQLTPFWIPRYLVICLDPLLYHRVYDNLKIHGASFKVSRFCICERKSFKMWFRCSWEAQEPTSKGKESHAFVWDHVISKLTTQKIPFFLFPVALARSLLTTSRSADVFVYSHFQHASLTSVLEVPVRKIENYQTCYCCRLSPEKDNQKLSCGHLGIMQWGLKASVPVTESTKILLSESWRAQYCPWKHTSA